MTSRNQQAIDERCRTYAGEIEKLTKLIAARAQNANETKHKDWGHVGTLAHTRDVLVDLIVSSVIGKDESEQDARIRVLDGLDAIS